MKMMNVANTINSIKQLPTKTKFLTILMLQIFLIIVIVSVVNISLTRQDNRVAIYNNAHNNIPIDKWEAIKQKLWYVIKVNIANVDENYLDDIAIRENSYLESEDNIDGAKVYEASFLVDIDSLKQTYRVTTRWSKSKDVIFSDPPTSIECPPKFLMKYPETECRGMTTTTASPQLYLPYSKKNDDGITIYDITQDNTSSKTIKVLVWDCEYEKNKTAADEYLQSTGIELEKYNIVYEKNFFETYCKERDK